MARGGVGALWVTRGERFETAGAEETTVDDPAAEA